MNQEIQLENTDLENPSSLIIQGTVKRKLTLIPLIFLIYFEVSGGPYGEEPAVQAAGPLFALLGFLIFPFIWSIPEALITAELATAYPGNGGFVIWASEAFGPFWGSMMGSMKFLSGSLNNAAYPVMMAKYVKENINFSDFWLQFTVCVTTILLAILNYCGVTIVGWVAACLGVVSLTPFIIMGLMAIPQIKWYRLLSLGKNGRNFRKNDWTKYFTTLFWNLNFWDNASTLAEEIQNPQKIFPRALFFAGIIACTGYLIPLIAITGALPLDQEAWNVGYLAKAAETIAGSWLMWWVSIGSVLSSFGLFEAQLTSSSFQTEGMANLRFLPGFFAWRSNCDTPWAGILLSSAISLGITFLNFENILSAANFLYGMSMLLEFSAFIWLRIKKPDLDRPYKVPANVPILCIMCGIPAGFVVYVLVLTVISKLVVFYIVAGLTCLSVCNYFLMNYCKSKGCIKFNTEEDKNFSTEEDNDEQVVEKQST